MKIAYEIERLSTKGGIERILTDRVNYMAEVWGWDIYVLVLLKETEEPWYKLSSKVHVEYLNVGTSGLMMCAEALWKLDKAVRRIKPDVYVTFQSIGAISCMLRTHSVPTVYEAHGARSRMPHPLAMTMAERYADVVVVLGERQKNDYRKARRLAVIPNFTMMTPKAMPDYASEVAVAAGRVCYQKNFERLESLWGKVQETFPQWQLRVHHDTKDMAAAYQEGSVLVMTSRFEGFPMVLIEAMTCGLPCVAFDCPYGPSELIEDGKTGYLIPYDDDQMFMDKLSYLMRHPEIRRRMGEEARKSVERFSVESVMAKWKKLYEGFGQNKPAHDKDGVRIVG